MQNEQSEQIYRAIGGIELFIGIGSLFFPGLLMKLYGVKVDLGGPGRFGWGLFAIRNIYVGGKCLAGDAAARDTILAMQVPDIAVFWKCQKDGDIPTITAIMATLTAALVGGLSLVARSKS